MATATPIIQTIFTVADRATPTIVSISTSFTEIQRSALSLNKIIGGLSFGYGLKSVIDLGSSFEDTALSIAGNIKAFELAPTFEAAQAAATRALDVIDAKAAKLPGEAEQYVEVFKTALPKAIESGLTDMTKIADFTSQYTAVAIANQIDSTQAANDLFRMLSGQAGLDVRTFTSLQPHIKMTAKEFNALNSEQRRLAIENVLGKFAEPLEAASSTFGAKSGELISTFRKLAREASVPLFEGMKRTLEEITGYISTNREELLQMGRSVSEGILTGLRAIPPILRFMSEHMGEIKFAAEAFAVIWVAGTVASGISNVISLINTLTTAVTALNTAQAAGMLGKAGGLLSGAAGKIGAGVAASAGTIAAATGIGIVLYPKTSQAAETESELLRKSQQEGIYNEISLISGGLLGGIEGITRTYKAAVHGFLPFDPRDVIAVAQRMGFQQSDLEQGSAVVPPITPPTPDTSGKDKGTEIKFYNARFDIKQQFAEGFDPDRIAVAFANGIARMGEMKVYSQFSPAVSSGN